MSGPSNEQLELQQAQLQFYKAGEERATAEFGMQQGLLKQMQSVYGPILQRGPNQRGFSDAERSDLNAQAIEGTATNYAHAGRAVGEQLATRGGGDNPLESGVDSSLKQDVALSAAGEESREQSQVIGSDYAAGRQNFQDATSALLSASSQTAPDRYYSAATEAGSAAEKTANEINSERNSWMAPVFGAIGGAAGGLLANPKLF